MSTQDKSNIPSNEKPRQDYDPLPNIRLNRDFYHKARNRKWIQQYGAEALIILQVVWIESSQERECRIHKKDIPYLAFPISCTAEKIFEVLDAAVLVGLLEQDGDYFFNSKTQLDSKAFQSKRSNYRAAWNKRHRIHDKSIMNPCMNSSRIHNETINGLSMDYTEPDPEPEYDPDPDLESNKNGAAEVTSPPLDEADEAAELKLESPNGKAWANGTVHVATGRRPMKDYPELWFTRSELASVLRDYRDSGIPDGKWKRGFLLAQSRAKKPTAGQPGLINAYAWMLGFIKSDLMNDVRNENYMKKSEESKNGKRT